MPGKRRATAQCGRRVADCDFTTQINARRVLSFENPIGLSHSVATGKEFDDPVPTARCRSSIGRQHLRALGVIARVGIRVRTDTPQPIEAAQVHGDTPGSDQLAVNLREAFEAAGVAVKAVGAL